MATPVNWCDLEDLVFKDNATDALVFDCKERRAYAHLLFDELGVTALLNIVQEYLQVPLFDLQAAASFKRATKEREGISLIRWPNLRSPANMHHYERRAHRQRWLRNITAECATLASPAELFVIQAHYSDVDILDSHYQPPASAIKQIIKGLDVQQRKRLADSADVVALQLALRRQDRLVDEAEPSKYLFTAAQYRLLTTCFDVYDAFFRQQEKEGAYLRTNPLSFSSVARHMSELLQWRYHPWSFHAARESTRPALGRFTQYCIPAFLQGEGRLDTVFWIGAR